MITLHHLSYSRSLRIIWLLEELDLPYGLVSYERTKEFRAPSKLAKVHPLGKAPVMIDGNLILAESGTIPRYLNTRYGNGRLTPPLDTVEHAIHDEWLDYVESSASLPILISLLGQMTGGLPAGLAAFASPELAKTLGHIESRVATRAFLMGDALTLADIQMSYLLSLTQGLGELKTRPVLAAY